MELTSCLSITREGAGAALQRQLRLPALTDQKIGSGSAEPPETGGTGSATLAYAQYIYNACYAQFTVQYQYIYLHTRTSTVRS